MIPLTWERPPGGVQRSGLEWNRGRDKWTASGGEDETNSAGGTRTHLRPDICWQRHALLVGHFREGVGISVCVCVKFRKKLFVSVHVRLCETGSVCVWIHATWPGLITTSIQGPSKHERLPRYCLGQSAKTTGLSQGVYKHRAIQTQIWCRHNDVLVNESSKITFGLHTPVLVRLLFQNNKKNSKNTTVKSKKEKKKKMSPKNFDIEISISWGQPCPSFCENLAPVGKQ